MAETPLRRTPLHAEHLRLDARLVPFAGYEMPVHYPTGITAEHRAVREAAGLFDVSHMGEFEVRGPDAAAFLQRTTSNDVERLEVGQAQYSTLPREDGTLLDDLLVYRHPDRYMLVVNAANRERDLAWLREHAEDYEVEIDDRSEEIALLALQGPGAEAILARLTDTDLSAIGYYRFVEGEVAGVPATISRTGYTGEDGFELYLAADEAQRVWRELLEIGQADGLVPAGLGCRDSLRLEMGYALYGHDLDDATTPYEAGLGWVTKLDTGFIGADALRRQKEEGTTRRLVGFRLLERGFPREGYEVERDGEPIGTVTSGTSSPTLGEGIGMAYVDPSAAKPGTSVGVRIRDRVVPAEVVRPPFHTGGSVRTGG